jgi:hypothetical protein
VCSSVALCFCEDLLDTFESFDGNELYCTLHAMRFGSTGTARQEVGGRERHLPDLVAEAELRTSIAELLVLNGAGQLHSRSEGTLGSSGQ